RLAWILLWGVGCTTTNETTTSATDDGGSSGAGTSIGSTNASTTVGTTASNEAGSSGGVTTAGSESTGDVETSDAEDTTTGPPPIHFCGLEDLKPGAPNPIVAGTEPMMIPPDIAVLLVDNCGCHYADMLTEPAVPDYSGLLPFKMETWEQWQGMYGFPGQEKSTIDVSLERIRDAPTPTTMPHKWCNVGDGEHMLSDERQILIDWLVAGAPDGATWMP
ncbi:MAG TPA: hypothetical protein VG755_18980, partial [Nannocystaceae bacterium]|nr:hypothetical protein [Nannocystaceae bacterium]